MVDVAAAAARQLNSKSVVLEAVGELAAGVGRLPHAAHAIGAEVALVQPAAADADLAQYLIAVAPSRGQLTALVGLQRLRVVAIGIDQPGLRRAANGGHAE